MNDHLKQFTNHTAYNAVKDNLDTPNVSLCVQENEVHYKPIPHDYSQDYLTFVALEDGTFQFSHTVNYSLDDGQTWVELATNTPSPTITSGNKIIWKRILTPPTGSSKGTFSATGDFDVQGNIMSLVYGDNFRGVTDLTDYEYVFEYLFQQNTHVINSENLIIPATTATVFCYAYMFEDCINLITSPKILPATTLGNDCYLAMFNGCSSLTTSPILPALQLAYCCYQWMFNGCTNLNYIKAMFIEIPDSVTLHNWVKDVASTGTFVKNSAAQWDVVGTKGVPSGWTIETASE